MAKKSKKKEDETKKVVANCNNLEEVITNCDNPQETSLSQYDIECTTEPHSIVHCVKGDFYPKQEESIPIPIAAEE